jgi:hypothetical protein
MATLRALLKPIQVDALETMKEMLLRKFHEKCTELLDLYKQKSQLLAQNPDKIEPFAAYVEMVMKIREEGTCSRTRVLAGMLSAAVDDAGECRDPNGSSDFPLFAGVSVLCSPDDRQSDVCARRSDRCNAQSAAAV